jgi:hypothetical protein
VFGVTTLLAKVKEWDVDAVTLSEAEEIATARVRALARLAL